MKSIAAIIFALLFLCGCSGTGDSLEPAMLLRDKLLKGNGCDFDAKITADYSDVIFTFGMECHTDRSGTMQFCVTSPETIAQIRGTVSEGGGNLTFDEQVLAFEMLADGMVTPVIAPWLMIHALTGGYIHACGMDADGVNIQIDDTYAQGSVQADIRLDGNGVPMRAEIYYEGRRILLVEVSNFQIV